LLDGGVDVLRAGRAHALDGHRMAGPEGHGADGDHAGRVALHVAIVTDRADPAEAGLSPPSPPARAPPASWGPGRSPGGAGTRPGSTRPSRPGDWAAGAARGSGTRGRPR